MVKPTSVRQAAVALVPSYRSCRRTSQSARQQRWQRREGFLRKPALLIRDDGELEWREIRGDGDISTLVALPRPCDLRFRSPAAGCDRTSRSKREVHPRYGMKKTPDETRSSLLQYRIDIHDATSRQFDNHNQVIAHSNIAFP